MPPTTFILPAAITSLLLASAVLPAAARAADLYATTDGTGDCASVLQPCRLGTAIALARGEDRVLVYPGVHGITGTVADDPAAGHVEIVAAPGESRPVIDLTGGRLDLLHGTDLRGVDVITTAGTAVRASGGTLDHLRVSVSGADTVGVELGDGAVMRNSAVMVSGSRSTGILATAATPGSELRGATIIASGIDAAALRVAPVAPATTASVRAVNTILHGTGGAVDVHAAAAPGQTAIALLDHVASSPANHALSGPGAAIVVREGQVGAVPSFQDRANGDLRQTSASPTIDAGTADVDGDGTTDVADAVAGGATDLDGSPRRLGVPDVGADEREMPPLATDPELVFDGDRVALRVTVQPRGQLTEVAADWEFDGAGWTATGSIQASGNDPVTLVLPLGIVPPGARFIAVQTRASNSAGTTQVSLSVAVPAAAVREVGSGVVAPMRDPVAAPPKLAAVHLPGALPVLAAKSAVQTSGTFAFRLRCHHSVSCRGDVVLTRLGSARTATFKIPPGGTRTVRLRLDSAEASKVRRAAGRGVRGLLEVRSLDEGSSFSAVRLFHAKPGARP